VHVSPAAKFSAVQALADESSQAEALDYAYGDYQNRDSERPFPGV